MLYRSRMNPLLGPPATLTGASIRFVPAGQAELQEAVYDLHQYLSDHKAPLMVADSVTLLLQYPPEFFAEQLRAWVSAQAVTAPVSDYLYHGAKKLALMGDFELVPKEALAKYLGDLGTVLLQLCPEADREVLKQNLDRLGHAATATVAAAGVLHRQSGVQTPQPEAAAAPPEQALSREMRRLSLLLEHLRPLASAPPEQRTEVASQFMSAAAVQSKSVSELEQHLAPLRQFGIETGTEQVFRTLASSLPGWALPSVAGQEAPAVSREQLKAMSQIVSLAEDPAEVAKRFREMVHAAVEQFNEGHLGRAVTMFELAERLVAQQKVKPVFVDALRSQGHEYLDQERLKNFAAREDNRARLRPILSFFTALQPPGLLKSLDGEPSRERRHQLLALLEAHEQAARKAAWDLLQASVEEGAQVDPFFQMNLVYLLRIIPRQEGTDIEAEVNVVMRASGRSSPPPLIKQIIAYLAHSRHEKAERALITYLKVFESMLLQPETAVYPPQEVEVLLERTCAALARYGSPRAWRLLIDHGLKSEARLGSPFLRLGEAGRLDFSKNKDLVERVITALRAELPKGGVLGFAGKKNEDKAVALIQALAGTPLPEVRAVLQEITSKYPDRKLGEAATKALEALASAGKPAPPPAGFTGDLELFGLPNLLQTFSQTQVSGVLSLMNAQGKPQASLLFETGQFRGGQHGTVLGEEAVYQLLERPFPGTFAFVSRRDVGSQPNVGPPIDIFPLLLEGVRRHDEFKVAAAVAPDGMALKPTGKPHTPLAEEDPAFAGHVWEQASGGKTPLQCEAVIKADAYRVRRLIAHWMEEGALQQG